MLYAPASSRPGSTCSSRATACRLTPRLGHLARVEAKAREPAQRLALGQTIAALPMQLERIALGLDRRIELTTEIALQRQTLQKLGPELRGGAPRPQRPRVLGGRLPMGADGPRAPRRSGRVPQHRTDVLRRLRVVGEARQIRRPGRGRGKRREHRAMQRQPAVRRQRLLDDQPRQLVPERHPDRGWDEHPSGYAPLELAQALERDRLQQPELDLRGDDRDRLKQAHRRRTEPRGPGKNRVLDRGRHAPCRRDERLGHEEGVSAGQRPQLLAIDAMRARKPRDRRPREALELEPIDRLT